MSDSDSDSSEEYEARRRRNIAEKERMFAELGLNSVILATKKILGEDDEFKENITKHEGINSPRSRQRDSVKIPDLLPTRRSLRIERKIHRVKRVKGFKGFSGNCNYVGDEIPNGYSSDVVSEEGTSIPNSLNESNSILCSNKEQYISQKIECTCSMPLIRVRFPWHKQLYSKINPAVSAFKRNEDDAQEGSKGIQKLSVFEGNEISNLKRVFKYSSEIKLYENMCPSDSSGDDLDESDDNWDNYDKVEFYVLVPGNESNKGSVYDSTDEMPREKRHKRFHSRTSISAVHNISPEEVTEDIIKNIAKRGTNKIYDQINGTTCHQCRQKTSDTKTICRSGRCVGVRGMFCGLCLPNRYGESVEEALKNPDWQCPVCRSICNCSFCRARSGKTPTGILYPTIKNHGYGNVAEFLKECDKENNSVNCERKRMKVVGVSA